MSTPNNSSQGTTGRKRRRCTANGNSSEDMVLQKDENLNEQSSLQMVSTASPSIRSGADDGYDSVENDSFFFKLTGQNPHIRKRSSYVDCISKKNQVSDAFQENEKMQVPIKKNPIQHVRFCVEASYIQHSSSKYELTNLICQPVVEQTNQRDSLSSGYMADTSKAGSPTSATSSSYVPPIPLHLNRLSFASTISSTASNIASSAAALATQSNNKKGCVHKDTINKLKKKWKNTELLYSLLEHLDQLLCDDPIVHNVLNSLPMRTRKRCESIENMSADESSKKLKISRAVTPLNEVKGQKVFAKWKNRKYYFGYIVETLDDDRVKVEYLDKSSNVVKSNQVITDFTSLIGNSIMTSKDGDNYFPGIVTAVDFENGNYIYSVATNNGDFPVDVSHIHFTEGQAKYMRVNQSSNVPSDNEDLAEELRPSCSGTQCLTDSGSSSDCKTKPLEECDLHVFGCDIETNEPQNLNSSLKLKNLQGKTPKRSNKTEDLLLGPLDVKGEWFKGYNFLITCSVNPNSNISSEEVHPDNEEFSFSLTPFIRDRLVHQIKLGGGTVLQALEDVEKDIYNKTYLITNRPCLTPKYLQCLAHGVKILSHEWIVACTTKQEFLPIQELPAGWSIEESRYINMLDRPKSLPLLNRNILVAQYDNPNFSKFWVHICNALGADATTFVGTFENTDVIVVEDGMHCPKLSTASSLGVPLVSCSWVVQTIIHGEARSYAGHDLYNYLYE